MKYIESSEYQGVEYPNWESFSDLKSIYLNLLIRTLTNSMYPESEDKSKNGGWPLYSHTMLPTEKLNTIRYCIDYCLENDIDGDLIETGVWRGGAVIFMEGVLHASGALNKKVYVADSFEGLPCPSIGGCEEDAGSGYFGQRGARGKLPWAERHKEELSIGLEEVKNNFKKYNLLKDNVFFVKGFFEHSMKNIDIDKLCLLRLDGDMYSSTIVVLNELYDKVTKGGFVIIDDWKLPQAQKAVVDFRKNNNITEPLLRDGTGVFWQKKT
jgi:O-methyltransferase